MTKLKMESKDMTQYNIEQIAQMFPQVVTEVADPSGAKDEEGKPILKKAIDFEKLKLVLSADSGDYVVADDERERYEFTWVGKRQSMVDAATPIRKTLRPCPEESKSWDSTENLYIEGDNLEVLKILQESYLGKVKIIYIDPPYNTGNDFVYNDTFKQSDSEYNEKSGMYDDDDNKLFQNSKSNGRFHSDWCSMIYPRLQLARNLLTDDGVIFISIDDNEVENLKKICNEVFGASNFVSCSIWRSSDNSNNDAKQFSTDHNCTLIYSKMSFWQPLKQFDAEKQKHFKNPDNDPKGAYFDSNPLNSPNYREKLSYKIVTPNGNIIAPPKNGWRWSKETLNSKIASGEIRFNENETNIRRRTYLCDTVGLPPSSLWINLDKTGHNRQAKYELLKIMPEDVFDTPKPVKLILYILDLINGDNYIAMDFFSGSSTTAHAIMQYNATRNKTIKHIMVQLPENLEESYKKATNDKKTILSNAISLCKQLQVKPLLTELGKERIRRAGEKVDKERIDRINKEAQKEGVVVDIAALDTGFRVFKTDSTNMKDVYYSATDTTQANLFGMVDNIKDDRTDIDLLYGCLLDWGVPLSQPHRSEEIDGSTVHFVNDTNLVACFDDKVTEQTVREIAELKPLRALFRDHSFEGSANKINVYEIFKSISPDTTVKVI